MTQNSNSTIPKRINSYRWLFFVLPLLALVVYSIWDLDLLAVEITASLLSAWDTLGEMFPPDFSRMKNITGALWETFEMALIGTILGVIISLPLGILASRNQSPAKVIYLFTRALISLARTVPDLVWAIFFVITVGIGPLAGVLTLMVDTIGFCGRFFAEAVEESERGPVEALKSIGAKKLSIIMCAIVPACLPSWISSSLFSLEKAVRSSVVLGLVGAGGIGIELKVSLDMLSYAEASAIILCIFALVLVVERSSAWIRARVM